MTNFICTTCGVQCENTTEPPNSCNICKNDRQYVGWDGQKWTSLEEMRQQGFKNDFTPLSKGLHQIVTRPSFGLGQRAFFVKSDSGNILWDCITYLDADSISAIKDLGGINCIAISHPHFYSAAAEWSEAFGEIPIYIHSLDRAWVQRKSPRIVYWKGNVTKLLPVAELVNLGGHFDGSSVLHLRGGDFRKGMVLSGDTLFVAMDRRWVTFMYSYPNFIPLPARKVNAIAARMKPYKFQDMYSGFEGREIIGGADVAVQRSARRYVSHLKN